MSNSHTAGIAATDSLFFLAEVGDKSLTDLALTVYERVARTDFKAPGFCLVDLGERSSSLALRRTMVALVEQMRPLHRSRTGRDLYFVSAARFDQQATTRPHRDGAPEESLLVLGYEPSPVRSHLAFADYARCAHEMGLTPAEFLIAHNPMFGMNGRLLEPYTTPLTGFSNERFQIVFVNNSIAAFAPHGGAWQGVLHTATVENPSESLRRVVNSVMVASANAGTAESLAARELEEFQVTSTVRRRGYDNPERKDDR